MNNQDSGFVLSVQPYREHDAMVLFLGETYGLIRLVLPGFYKASTKQGALGIEFTKVLYRFNYRENQLLRIQTGELKNPYLKQRDTLDWLLKAQFLSELCTRYFDEAQKQDWLKWLSTYLETPSDTYLIYVVAQLIVYLGYVPYVEGCLITHDSKVSDFSIEKGGFVSAPYRTHESKVTLDVLKGMRHLFGSKSINMEYLEALEDKVILLQVLVSYLEYHTDTNFGSWKVISSV